MSLNKKLYFITVFDQIKSARLMTTISRHVIRCEYSVYLAYLLVYRVWHVAHLNICNIQKKLHNLYARNV